ncbi:MAG: FlgD immunoglobulin-like domain containing protein [Candidatus Eisenbacteria bacterium]
MRTMPSLQWPFVFSVAASASSLLLLSMLHVAHARSTSLVVEPLVPAPSESVAESGRVSSDDGRALSAARAPGDTLYLGFVDDDGFAVLGETWTFDHGSPDPLEGWTSDDLTEQEEVHGRFIDGATWNADPFNLVAAPVLRGQGSAWIGDFGSEALAQCWVGGVGYGNDWRQRFVSPAFTWDGTSDVILSWVHFYDVEEDYDYSLVYLRTLPSGEETELRRFTAQGGLAPDHPVSPPVGLEDSLTLTAADFHGESEFQIIFAMTSDGTWSDEDGLAPTEYGALAVDDVRLDHVGPAGSDTVLFGFESDLEGWSAEPTPGVGVLLGTAPLSGYMLPEFCGCGLSGNVLEIHDGAGIGGTHPTGQHEMAISPIVDLLNDAIPAFPPEENLLVEIEWDQFADLPRSNGVFYRAGAYYFPWVCEETGEIGWSPRTGIYSFFFVPDPICDRLVLNASAVDNPLPQDAEQVKFVYEVFSSCDAFGIPPEDCTGVTNASPLVDNVRFRVSSTPAAPLISFADGTRFQDGYPQGTQIYDEGNADVSRNVHGFGTTPPIILGDSLVVEGPRPGSATSSWETKLWFRVSNVSPYASTEYEAWRDRVADGVAIDSELAGDGPIGFAWAYMDSCQQGTLPFPYKFCSYFREDDDDFDAGAGELASANEILPDGLFQAGTQIEYFVTANYVGTPEYRYILPDTAGGNFLEFEILPRVRKVGSHYEWPSVLYIDADEADAQSYIEEALAQLGVWYDRYDYGDPNSIWKAPLERRNFGNNGASARDLIRYQTIILNTGSRKAGDYLMWPEDFDFLSWWLGYAVSERQGLLVSGDGIASRIAAVRPSFLAKLGASLVSDSYRDWTGDDRVCIPITVPEGAEYGTEYGGPYEHRVYGDECPIADYDVLGAVGDGVGNRSYQDAVGDPVDFEQIATHVPLQPEAWRAVLDGVSWHRMALESGGGCEPTHEEIVQAVVSELGSALAWLADFSNTDVHDAPGGPATTALYAARPSPFPETTEISFQLANSQDVEITVFDAQGRQVRRLIDGKAEAGLQSVTWDGRDDAGHDVPSGLYWYRMRTEGYERAARVLRLR